MLKKQKKTFTICRISWVLFIWMCISNMSIAQQKPVLQKGDFLFLDLDCGGLCDAIEAGTTLDPKNSKRKVLGIDIDIRAHNHAAIEAHPMASRIQMIRGSSIAPEIIGQVKEVAQGYNRILVCLDSNHTHDHVLAELEAYAPLTSVGSYCVVFDTIIEDMPADMFPDRSWGPSNNPKTAVWEYLKTHPEFEIDKSIQHKLLITVAPDGYIVRKY